MTDVPSADLLARCREHDQAAGEELFRRYAERLARLARSRLSSRLAARVDGEDVAMSAWRSFFRLADGGEILIRQSGDLWRLLVRITLRKVCRSARRHRAGCRTVDREQPWPADEADEAALLAREPTPADAGALLDELRCSLAPLSPTQRRSVELRLEGRDVEEIASAVGRSARTVRRTLAALGEELERRLISAPPAPPAVTHPREMLRYGDVVLRQQLGEGGMGKVYRALLRPADTPVAVKILRKPLRRHETAAGRFLEEADLLARLHHPGVVAVRGLGTLPDGGLFLVMDLVEGSDLARQASAGPVAVEQASRWVSEAADAVDHAHRQGVVHCDLKPSNLLLGADGRVRVTDFGLARSLAVRRGHAEPAVGGTPGFMAPEQIDPARGPVSPRTDVHGLGAVLYALLAGRPPFGADSTSPSEREAPPKLTSLRADVPERLEEVCFRCLEEAPEKRFASAREVAQELRFL
jgi:RNA polymerase sigma factor (sigma-70 family)